MWICLDNAFLSVVADKHNPSRLLVRARRRNHLTRVFGKNVKIRVWKGTDYKYRTFVSRAKFNEIMLERLEAVTYTNFKAHAQKKDEELSRLYGEWWHAHFDYQQAEGRPWGYEPYEPWAASSPTLFTSPKKGKKKTA